MSGGAYYNEIDPFAAEWLRELMREGLIAPGVVDERSIEDVCPEDLDGFIQCHFFAGIGIWSLALRLAGWPDNREIWTGSCPCQPFSAAGQGNGFADERHLWPAFEYLIRKRRPVTVVGEQVASADGLHWLDLVSSDMEGQGYAFGALDTCAAGFSAPHIRQRLYWLGHAFGAGLEGYGGDQAKGGRNASKRSVAKASIPVRLDDAFRVGRRARRGNDDGNVGILLSATSAAGGVAYSDDGGRPSGGLHAGSRQPGQAAPVDHGHGEDGRASLHPLNYWADADWLLCRDPDGPRFRPVEPGAFPLVDAGALRNRLASVRGAGNAINFAQAQGFLEAAFEVIAELDV